MCQWIRVCFLAGCIRDKSALPSLHDCALVFQSKTRVEGLGTLDTPQRDLPFKQGFTIIICILFLHRALTYPNLIAVLVLFVGKGSCDSSKCFKTQKALINITAFYFWLG